MASTLLLRHMRAVPCASAKASRGFATGFVKLYYAKAKYGFVTPYGRQVGEPDGAPCLHAHTHSLLRCNARPHAGPSPLRVVCNCPRRARARAHAVHAVFAHSRDFAAGTPKMLVEGQEVEFDIVQTNRGPRAKNLVVVADAAEERLDGAAASAESGEGSVGKVEPEASK